MNSTSTSSSISSTLALGAGCYWGTEKYIKRDFQKKFPNAIKSAKVGFMSPNKNAVKNPTYQQVCSGLTGHVEVLFVELNDPTPELFRELIKFFFTFHDPTTANRQGNDVGSQYASYIFTTDSVQKDIAQDTMSELQKFIDTKKINCYASRNLSTRIACAAKFYEAHEEHQEYLNKHPNGYCNHFFRFRSWPASAEYSQ